MDAKVFNRGVFLYRIFSSYRSIQSAYEYLIFSKYPGAILDSSIVCFTFREIKTQQMSFQPNHFMHLLSRLEMGDAGGPSPGSEFKGGMEFRLKM